MTSDEALALIHQALATALEKDVAVTPQTDLFADGILDSLDTMIFFLNLEELSGAKFPDKNLVEAGYNKVSRIIEHLAAQQSPS
ncbi:MAG TPA: acyl carrier protein [Chthoniobacteraceae bacterium]|jgi:acyl carrier protein|nr:acyl carrier protein [Chthoniobacter sp.]HEV7868197.1 acyl carrier protein [Chthoniobacteraceae bacterium]